MKKSGSNIGSKGKLNCSVQGKTGKNTQKLVAKVPENPVQVQANSKPLYGKVFYLDLPSNVFAELLEKDIKLFGGTIEGFLSKDITYLISNKKEAKFARTRTHFSPEASPESTQNAGNGSPLLKSKKASLGGGLQKSSETVRVSRGKSLVEKVIKEQEIIPSNSILSNALSWGVKVIHADDIKFYLEQKKKEFPGLKKPVPLVKAVVKGTNSQKTKTGRLKKPFVKVEDRTRHYRPFYLQLSSFPVINYSIAKTCSPFDVDKKMCTGQKHIQATVRNKITTERESETQVQLNCKKTKKGYCECCVKKYEDLQSHLESEQHRTFAESAHYQVVDDEISKFVYDFVEYSHDKNKRMKCSTGAIVPVVPVLRKDQLEKRLKQINVLQQQHQCKNKPISSMQDWKSDEQATDALNSSLQKPIFISEPACSPSFHHSSFTSEVVHESENRETKHPGHTDEMTVISNCVKLPPPQRGRNDCIKTFPKVCENPVDMNHKTHMDDENLLGPQAKTQGCTSRTQAQVNGFNETLKKTPKFVSRLSLLKRKIDGSLIFPTKCWKIHDLEPVLKIPDDFRFETHHLEEKYTIHEMGESLYISPAKDGSFTFPENELKTTDFDPVVGEIPNDFRLENHYLEESCTIQEFEHLIHTSPRKDGLFIVPTKCFRTSDFDPVCKIHDCFLLETHPLEESCTNRETGQLLLNPSIKGCTNEETTQLLHNPTLKEQTCDSSTDNLPSVKLQRKVKVCSGRHKKGNTKLNVGLCCWKANEATAEQEDNVAVSLSVESWLELFQTSGERSDFLGFSGCSGADYPSCPNDYWEEQSSVTPWSLFGLTSSSASSFLGF